ncbi:MAG: sulfurtransferase TusA family protein [Candidatus Heimdallarchaeota archaeon]|nr:sulfurtransferase TusA family protein [Candidatus Heimdallarchaeota archaeon]
MTQFDQELDASGLSCPMPILRTAKAIKKMDSGKVLKVTSTDPGSVEDIPKWVTKQKHDLLKNAVEGEKYVFYIKKK